MAVAAGDLMAFAGWCGGIHKRLLQLINSEGRRKARVVNWCVITGLVLFGCANQRNGGIAELLYLGILARCQALKSRTCEL